jgi:ketosteroid isomerase-like protein
VTSMIEADFAIRQLHARYMDAVWRMDFDAFGDCFTDDCEWRIGGVVLRGRDEIVEHNRTLFTTKFKRLFITLRTPILELHEDGTASGRTYFSAQNLMADGSGFSPLGVYYERFVDGGDRWRSSWRLFQTLYTGPADLSGSFHDVPDFGAPPAMPPLDATTANVSGLHVDRDRTPSTSSGRAEVRGPT